MGEFLGIPEWAAVALIVFAGLVVWMTYGYWTLRRGHARVLLRRPNPSEAEFLAMMEADCSSDAARFVWHQTLPYIEPILTPHPDDDLLADLMIDQGDFDLGWTVEWAELRGFHESNFPDWPEDWLITVRNYARWPDRAPE